MYEQALATANDTEDIRHRSDVEQVLRHLQRWEIRQTMVRL